MSAAFPVVIAARFHTDKGRPVFVQVLEDGSVRLLVSLFAGLLDVTVTLNRDAVAWLAERSGKAAASP